MNNSPLFIALLVGMSVLSACQNDAPQQAAPPVGETTQPTPAPQDQTAPVAMPPSNAPAGGSATVPQTMQRQAAPAVAVPPPSGATAAGMNPPHGQPNHRCDIAVGAPLDSKPVPKPQ